MNDDKQLSLGITGHRHLGDPEAVAQALDRAVATLAGPAPPLYSALAEGSDRLAARSVLAAGGRLHVVLPLAPDDYRNDFADDASWAEFNALLSRAETVETVPPQPDRGTSYLIAGRRVADLCDILIAVWDGRPARGRGGTAEIVAHVRSAARPLYWIDSEDPARVVRERMPGDIR